MINRELIELLQAEPLDDEVAICLEGVYTTVIHLAETFTFADDPDKRQRTLLIEGE